MHRRGSTVRAAGNVSGRRRAGSRLRRVATFGLAVTAILAIALPAWAAITAPGSAHVLPGNSAGVNVSTDGSTVSVSGGHANISVGRGGSAPTFRFTFTAGTQAAPGSYGYTFFDDVGGQSSFTLIVDSPPATTTTTTQAPTTTTTRAPSTTTTTRAPATTTTTQPPETTTTTAVETTTTQPPETTTTVSDTLPPEPTTTTTQPPTTTTSTLVPLAIGLIDDNDTGSGISMGMVGSGFAVLALVIAGALAYRRYRPAQGMATGMAVAMRRNSEHRRLSNVGNSSRTAILSSWWRTSGPIATFHDWRSSRQVRKRTQQQIEDGRRLRGEDE